MEYVMPTAGQIPAIKIANLVTPSPLNPLGAKGVGEGGTLAPPAAIAAAVEDALRPFGAHIVGTPIRAEDVLRLIRRPCRRATGTYDLGYGDVNSMIEYNVKNPQMPLIAVGMVLNSPPFALLSLKRYGIREPKDLKGASIGAPAGDAPRRLWPIFAKNVGLPA